MTTIPIPQCRARRVNSSEVVTGYYAYKPIMDKYYIVREETIPYSIHTIFEEIEIYPDTLIIIDNHV